MIHLLSGLSNGYAPRLFQQGTKSSTKQQNRFAQKGLPSCLSGRHKVSVDTKTLRFFNPDAKKLYKNEPKHDSQSQTMVKCAGMGVVHDHGGQIEAEAKVANTRVTRKMSGGTCKKEADIQTSKERTKDRKGKNERQKKGKRNPIQKLMLNHDLWR